MASQCSCLILVSAYSTATSLAFIIVTVLYSTQGSIDCDVVTGENSEIKKLIHVDFLNLDKSLNADDLDGKMITEEEISGDETEHLVICDCGSELVFGIFEIIALSAIFIGFLWMTCAGCGQLRTVYMGRHERALERKKQKMDNLKKMVRRELDVEAKGSGKAQQGAGDIDTELK